MSTNSQFVILVLQIIIEERRTSHVELWNKKMQQQIFNVGDVVKAHIQVQSKSETVEVKKLSYLSWGPFQVKTVLGKDSYEVQRYNEP